MVLRGMKSPEDLDRCGDLYHRVVWWEHCLFDVIIGGDDQEKFKLYKRMKGQGIFHLINELEVYHTDQQASGPIAGEDK